MSSIEARIDELEIRAVHQDKMIAELNEVITAQWKKIDALERNLKRLNEEFEALEQGEAPSANQKPPHY